MWICNMMPIELVVITVAMALCTDSVHGAAITCVSCTNVANISECTLHVPCVSPNRCYTEATGMVGDLKFTLGCKSEQDCLTVSGHVDSGLIGKRSGTSISCRQCCAVNDCNEKLCSSFGDVIGMPTETCKDDPAIDCARLGSVFNMCSDLDHAKKICPHFCGLCELVDGSWSSWTTWSGCSVTCSDGHMTRNRTCTNPLPSHGGHTCVGNTTDTMTCHFREPCPVDGGWGDWQSWQSCGVTCGTGLRTRQRTCTNPAPSNRGDYCHGDEHSVSLCNETCEIDGGWTEWNCCSYVSQYYCSQARACANPAPQYNGSECSGSSFQRCNRGRSGCTC